MTPMYFAETCKIDRTAAGWYNLLKFSTFLNEAFLLTEVLEKATNTVNCYILGHCDSVVGNSLGI